MLAAPFDGSESNDDNNEIHNNNQNYKKRQHNRTQKNVMKNMFNPEKINSVLQSIHDTMNNGTTDIDGNSLGDYYSNPPPNPTSIGSQRAADIRESTATTTGMREGMQSNSNEDHYSVPSPVTTNDDLDLNNFQGNYFDEKGAEEYYKKFVPNYTPSMMLKTQPGKTSPYYQQQQQQQQQKPSFHKNDIPFFPSTITPPSQNIHTTQKPNYDNHDILIQKLNYMIHLLEEKQDERTNNVTEEVVLYSFLGIFIIFVVDSFTRVGKYTR